MYLCKEVDPSTTYVVLVLYRIGYRFNYVLQEYDDKDDAEAFFIANSEDNMEGMQHYAEIIKVR